MDLTRLSPWSIAASVGGVALGIYAGFNLLAPAAFSGIAWFALHNMAPTAKRPVVPAVAWQFGQLGWFLFGAALAPGGLAQLLPDIVILAGLLIWFYISQSRASAWSLIVYQALSALINAWLFLHTPMESDTAKALVTHISWRVVAIVLLMLFIRRPAQIDPAVAAKTFE
jgi:hypothetical protein